MHTLPFHNSMSLFKDYIKSLAKYTTKFNSGMNTSGKITYLICFYIVYIFPKEPAFFCKEKEQAIST